MHCNYMKKLLSPHRFGHSVFTTRKIINKVFALLFWENLHLTSWMIHNPVRPWLQYFHLRGVTVSKTAVKILEMYLLGFYLNSLYKSTPSKIFLNGFNQIWRTQIWKACLGGYFWKVPRQHFHVGSTWWINVEIRLFRRWKWNKIRRQIFNVGQRWYNVGVRHWHSVETTWIQLYLDVVSRCPQH